MFAARSFSQLVLAARTAPPIQVEATEVRPAEDNTFDVARPQFDRTRAPDHGRQRRRGALARESGCRGRQRAVPAADRVLDERGVVVVPDVLANAAGVTCSYFEQVQGNTNEYWRRDQVFDKLDATLGSAFPAVHDVAEHGDLSLRQAAYLIAIDRVAQACRARMDMNGVASFHEAGRRAVEARV